MTRKYLRNANSSTEDFAEKENHAIIYIPPKIVKNTVKEEDALKGSTAHQDIPIIVSIGRKEPASMVKNASICTLT